MNDVGEDQLIEEEDSDDGHKNDDCSVSGVSMEH